jgi:hypothetical protein
VLGAWRVRVAEPSLRAALEPALEALARGEGPPDAEVVKRSRVREVLRMPLGADVAYLKRDRAERRLWRGPGTRREYENLLRLRHAGFPAVEPLAFADRRVGGVREGLLVTRALHGAVALSASLRRVDRARADALLGAAAGLARRLHEVGLWHRDLHTGNLLLQGESLWLVDVQKLRALPFRLPLALRARDLVWLVSDGRLGTAARPRVVAEAYSSALPGGPDLERFSELLTRAAARAMRARLRSRGRRCVVASTGFRSERRDRLCVLRRADVTTSAALAAASEVGERQEARLAEVFGGPPPGPAGDPFARGQGAPEPETPARAPAWVRRFGRGLALRDPLRLSHPGLRAWRLAHALLLRGVDTPAPLALVEQRRFGFVSHSLLLTRCAENAPELAVALADAPERARAAGRELARWHSRGVEAADLGLHFRVEAQQLVVTRPERARFHDPLTRAIAERDLACIAERLGPLEREALVAGYREAASS